MAPVRKTQIPLHLGFAMEYSLGHVTHAQNLKHALHGNSHIKPNYVDLPYDGMLGAWTKLPGVRSNWSVRASLGAYLALKPQAKRLQGMLFHTQVTSLFSPGLMRAVPSIISLDATPRQYDSLGAFYGHAPSENARIEAVKKRMNQRAFGAARHLVSWSEWAKASLIADYGVPADKITVIPPGIDTRRWHFPDRPLHKAGPVNLLFVGGDFPRKGGDTLLKAFEQLPRTLHAHLHIVTKTEGVGEGKDNVTVHHGITPNSSRLLQLFADADLFVFPTRGDCLPLAVMEALSAGLPVITTNVGALPEAVTDGETGRIVPADDAPALADAITSLVTDADLRAVMASRARAQALARFDAARNYQKLVMLLTNTASV